MKRWWYKEEGGTGMVPVKEAAYYKQGREIHSDLSRLLLGESLESVLEGLGSIPTQDQTLWEPHVRRIGWVVAFALYTLPSILTRYEVVSSENELILERGRLWVANTSDVVLRDKLDGRLVVWDFKTVKILSAGWFASWVTAIQLQILIRAVVEELGEPVKWAQIMGLTKGRETGGKLRHPYVWAYSDGEDKWSSDWKSGWDLRPTFEYPGGVRAWVEQLGEEVARSQFPTSQPVFSNERLLSRLLRRRLVREAEVERVREASQRSVAVRERYFEPRYSQCRPSFGDPCPFLLACHDADIGRDPIGSGVFVPRTPHHDVETMLRNEGDSHEDS
jgi:hypothetical protein